MGIFPITKMRRGSTQFALDRNGESYGVGEKSIFRKIYLKMHKKIGECQAYRKVRAQKSKKVLTTRDP